MGRWTPQKGRTQGTYGPDRRVPSRSVLLLLLLLLVVVVALVLVLQARP